MTDRRSTLVRVDEAVAEARKFKEPTMLYLGKSDYKELVQQQPTLAGLQRFARSAEHNDRETYDGLLVFVVNASRHVVAA